jgi:Leucine-rich repeat (LRR) protein
VSRYADNNRIQRIAFTFEQLAQVSCRSCSQANHVPQLFATKACDFLQSNHVTFCNRTIWLFEQLQLLNLAHNEVTAVHSSIGCCSSLEILHLHYNHLITLPYTIGLLTKLSRLTLHDNPSVGIPKQIISAGIDIAVDFLKKMLDANESKQMWLNNLHLCVASLRRLFW